MVKPVAVVKTYYAEEAFARIVKEAEKANIRGTGLFLYVKKKGSFKPDEVIPNTKGLAKFLKYCYRYYIEHEADRAVEAAKVLQEEKALQKRKQELGLL